MVPTTPPAVRQPGKAGLWIGSVLLLVGTLVGIGLVVVGALEVMRGLVEVPAVELGASDELELSAQGYELYLFNASGGVLPADDPEVTVESDSGEDLKIGPATEGTTGGASAFRSLGTFQVDEAGTFTVTVEELAGVASGVDVRVGDDFEDLVAGAGVWIVGGLAVGFIGFAGGLTLLIVTSVRRSRARRAMQAAWAGYAMTPPPGAPGGFGGPGAPGMPSGPVGAGAAAPAAWTPPPSAPEPTRPVVPTPTPVVEDTAPSGPRDPFGSDA